MDYITIRRGQVWRDNDKRMAITNPETGETQYRDLEVETVAGGGTHQIVALKNPRTGKITSAMSCRFVGAEDAVSSAKRTGYSLLKDVE